MVTEPSAAPQPGDEIKRVPRQPEARARLRLAAEEVAAGLDRTTPPIREALEALAGELLERLDEPREHLGFAMVAISNAFWRDQFEAVPTERRLLLLPKCLRDPERCIGTFDSVGLHCRGCGACPIHDLSERARGLGYEVVVAEGTSSVIMKVLRGDADAILGVSCLDALDKSFQAVADLGVPNHAIPLLFDGCVRTEAELDLIFEAMAASGPAADQGIRSPLPLLRETVACFEPDQLAGLVDPHLPGDASGADPLTATDAIALDWLAEGGKRLRPFVTVAAFVAARHGSMALATDAEVAPLVPDAVRRVAVAIEALHKASLVHDDIEDDDSFRYGRPTLHRTWGTGAAINVGDHLVGLGYRLIAGEAEALGGDCVADILARLAAAHLQLCRGQGAELLWQREERMLRSVDALTIAARKTAPAFEVALYAGLRAADAVIPEDALRRFSLYLGEAYQSLNDLDDWTADRANKVSLGRDVLAGRPTILRAFATESGGWEALARLTEAADPEDIVARARALYSELGAFAKTEVLVDRLRERALIVASEVDCPALSELLEFLVRTVLRRREAHGG